MMVSKRLILKRFIVFFFLFFAVLVSCAPHKKHISVSRYKKSTVVVPETIDGRPSRPYTVNGISYYPLPSGKGFVQEGVASWYGKKFHGRKTSSGEAYNMHDMTAAHKILPFGTYVRVINLRNQREVVVRINDRGPFVKKRVIDLSREAGKRLGLIGPGTAPVKVIALSKEVGRIRSSGSIKPVVEETDFTKGKFTIQVGAFEGKANATRLAKRLKVIFSHVTITDYILSSGKRLYRVRVSLSEDLNGAGRVVDKLHYLGFTETFIVAL